MLWKPARSEDEPVISLIEIAGTGDYRGRRVMFDLDHLTICRERDMRLGYTIAEDDFEQLVPVYDDVRRAGTPAKPIAPVQRGEFSLRSQFSEETESPNGRRDVSAPPNVEETWMNRGLPPF